METAAAAVAFVVHRFVDRIRRSGATRTRTSFANTIAFSDGGDVPILFGFIVGAND